MVLEGVVWIRDIELVSQGVIELNSQQHRLSRRGSTKVLIAP
jgi:hypothetical protein